MDLCCRSVIVVSHSNCNVLNINSDSQGKQYFSDLSCLYCWCARRFSLELCTLLWSWLLLACKLEYSFPLFFHKEIWCCDMSSEWGLRGRGPTFYFIFVLLCDWNCHFITTGLDRRKRTDFSLEIKLLKAYKINSVRSFEI